MQRGEVLAQLRPEDAPERNLSGFQHGDVAAGEPSGRGDFKADPSGADHHEPAAGSQFCPECGAVLEPPQGVDADELSSGEVEVTGAGAGGEHEPSVADGRSAAQLHLRGGAVDPDDLLSEQGAYIVVGVPLGGVNVQL